MKFLADNLHSCFNQQVRLLLGSISLIALYLLWSATPIEAAAIEIPSLMTPVEFTNQWKYQPGDNSFWASSALDDTAWLPADIVNCWQTPASNFSWYRIELKLSADTLAAQRAGKLGVALPQLEYCAYQLYANGELIGSFGSFPPTSQLPLPHSLVYQIPARVFGTDGRLVLAVRLWKELNYTRRAQYFSSRHDSGQNRAALGNYETIRDQLELAEQTRLRADLPKLFTAIFFIIAGLYHLQLYYSRRQLKEYLWFTLLALAFAINIFCNSEWANGIFPQIINYVLKISCRQFLPIAGIQFLWLLLACPIGSRLRLLQLTQVVCIAIVIILPDAIFTPLNGLIFLSMTPLLFFIVIKPIQESRRGNPDARNILFGCGAVVIIEIFEIIRILGLLKLPYLAHWGFFAFIASMALTLSNRFNRVYRELDSLNQELETKVIDRTAELASTNSQLAETVLKLQEAHAEKELKNRQLQEKNEELIASQQQADRIFSALAEALPGTVLDDKYQLDEKIGSGGYGAVFRGTHLLLNTAIAVKVFRPTSGNDSPEAVERFRREGVSTCRVNHPNAVSVFDSGVSAEGIAYIVMELLVGNSLKEELSLQGHLSIKRCAEIIIPVCEVLTEAHKAGIVHRDIKPDNIFLHQSKQGEIVKVVDFGIAKLISDQQEPDENLTESGSIVGTPIYMAPERLKNIAYDGRADVYSVGVMLYEMLTGARPFEISSSNVIEIIMKHLKTMPTPMKKHNPNMPSAIETVVMAALEKDPAKRVMTWELAEKFKQAVGGLTANELAEMANSYPARRADKSSESTTTVESLPDKAANGPTVESPEVVSDWEDF